MVVKRLGPSLVPAEVVVPLANLGAVMTEIEKKVHQPVVKEGVDDPERRRRASRRWSSWASSPATSASSATTSSSACRFRSCKIAEKHGGRAYSTGLYFSPKAEAGPGHGARRPAQRPSRSKVDPAGILNPGKVIGQRTVLGTAVAVAEPVEPLIRPFGNRVVTTVGERPTADRPRHPGGCRLVCLRLLPVRLLRR